MIGADISTEILRWYLVCESSVDMQSPDGRYKWRKVGLQIGVNFSTDLYGVRTVFVRYS